MADEFMMLMMIICQRYANMRDECAAAGLETAFDDEEIVFCQVGEEELYVTKQSLCELDVTDLKPHSRRTVQTCPQHALTLRDLRHRARHAGQYGTRIIVSTCSACCLWPS